MPRRQRPRRRGKKGNIGAKKRRRRRRCRGRLTVLRKSCSTITRFWRLALQGESGRAGRRRQGGWSDAGRRHVPNLEPFSQRKSEPENLTLLDPSIAAGRAGGAKPGSGRGFAARRPKDGPVPTSLPAAPAQPATPAPGGPQKVVSARVNVRPGQMRGRALQNEIQKALAALPGRQKVRRVAAESEGVD
jgi:hypothetical protein